MTHNARLQLQLVQTWLELAAAAGLLGDHGITLRAIANATKCAKALAAELDKPVAPVQPRDDSLCW